MELPKFDENTQTLKCVYFFSHWMRLNHLDKLVLVINAYEIIQLSGFINREQTP